MPTQSKRCLETQEGRVFFFPERLLFWKYKDSVPKWQYIKYKEIPLLNRIVHYFVHTSYVTNVKLVSNLLAAKSAGLLYPHMSAIDWPNLHRGRSLAENQSWIKLISNNSYWTHQECLCGIMKQANHPIKAEEMKLTFGQKRDKDRRGLAGEWFQKQRERKKLWQKDKWGD